MPKLVRFVVVNSLIGFGIGLLVALALVMLNANGLGTMYAASHSKFLVAVILGSSFGSTFSFGYLTTALMMLPTDKDEFDKV